MFSNRSHLAPLLLSMALVLLACSDDEQEGATDASMDTTTDTAGDQAQPDAEDQAEMCQPEAPWDVTVTLAWGEDTLPVNLGCLERTTYESQDAIRLTRVVELAALETPWNYHFDFIGSDNYDPLVERLDNDLARLPYFGELEQGYLYFDEGDLRVGWDESLGFPGSLSVRKMDGGTIMLLEIDPTSLIVHGGEIRALVDLSGLTTVDVVDYRHTDEPAIAVVPFIDVLTEAGLSDASGYAFKMTGMDGFSNNDDNLMPYVNAQHAYIDPAGRKILFAEETWDTDECCWRVKDVVLVRPIPTSE